MQIKDKEPFQNWIANMISTKLSYEVDAIMKSFAASNIAAVLHACGLCQVWTITHTI